MHVTLTFLLLSFASKPDYGHDKNEKATIDYQVVTTDIYFL